MAAGHNHDHHAHERDHQDHDHDHGHAHAHGHGHGHGHSHVPKVIKHERPLWIAFGLTLAVLVAEIVGGVMSNSLALLSDAAHMLTDVAALGISLFAVRLSRRPADARRSYGYARMEAIGALINGSMLFLVGGYILWEALQRFRAPVQVASTAMLIVACFGLIANMLSMRLLAAGAVLDLAILEKLMRRGIGAAFIQVPDTRDTATIAGELCSVNARIERIFRGPSNTVRDELRAAVQEFRSETSK